MSSQDQMARHAQREGRERERERERERKDKRKKEREKKNNKANMLQYLKRSIFNWSTLPWRVTITHLYWH